MKRLSLLLLAAVALAADEPTEQLAGLKWLAGSWSGEMWGGKFHAYYSTPEGGRVLSHSYLEKDGKAVFYEFETFGVEGRRVVYVPYPGGKRSKPFFLTGSKAQSAVFEQPEKDFPTRIAFERKDGVLRITLSDPHNESPKKEVFVLKKEP